VCFHGRHRTPHRIVEWDPPFRYLYASDIPGGLSALSEFRLEAVDDGSTRVRYRSGHPTGSKSGLLLMRALRPVARRALTSAAAKGLERLQALVAAEAADGDERPDG
jgi:hypothetical protein